MWHIKIFHISSKQNVNQFSDGVAQYLLPAFQSQFIYLFSFTCLSLSHLAHGRKIFKLKNVIFRSASGRLPLCKLTQLFQKNRGNWVEYFRECFKKLLVELLAAGCRGLFFSWRSKISSGITHYTFFIVKLHILYCLIICWPSVYNQ